MVAHEINLCIYLEAEVGRSEVPGQPELYSETLTQRNKEDMREGSAVKKSSSQAKERNKK